MPTSAVETRKIEDKDALAKRGYSNPDRLEDKAIQQELKWNFDRRKP
jgi:hypothetical protein